MTNYYVYVHKEKATGKIFYVGKGTGNRYITEYGRSRSWYRYTDTIEWEAEIVKNSLTEHAAFTEERKLIKLLGLSNLLNKSKGVNLPHLPFHTLTDTTGDYYRVGNGTMNKHKIQSIDLLEEVMAMSKPAQMVVRLIKDQITYDRDYNPVVKISRKTLTKSEQNYLDKGLKELFAKDLVRRIKQGHYMINPNALIPPNYEEALALWDSAGDTV